MKKRLSLLIEEELYEPLLDHLTAVVQSDPFINSTKTIDEVSDDTDACEPLTFQFSRQKEIMADQEGVGSNAADLKKKRTFRKFTFRGVDLDQLLDMSNEELMKILHCRARRRLSRGLKRKPMALIKRLRKAKKETVEMEKPQAIKTHLRDMIIVPEMVGCVVGVHQGKTFNSIEIKPEMIGYYLGEFSITYKPVKHGRPGIGATHSSRFIPLK